MAPLIDEIFGGHGGHPYGMFRYRTYYIVRNTPSKNACRLDGGICSSGALVGHTVKIAVRSGQLPADHWILSWRQDLGVCQSKFGFTSIRHTSSSHSGT